MWHLAIRKKSDSSVTTMMERAAFGSNYAGASSDGDVDIPVPPFGLQRQISRSEPHLNSPRFHIGQTAGDGDEGLNRAMSGLFGADAGYHVAPATPLDRSMGELSQVGDLPSSSNRGLLAVGGQPLRKSASAVDQRSLLPTSGINSSTNESNAMVGTSQQPDSLIRVSSMSGINPSSSSLVGAKNLQPPHSQNTSLVEQAAAFGPRPNNSFSNFFGRGFFAKPVMGSQEESYRYIMALDR